MGDVRLECAVSPAIWCILVHECSILIVRYVFLLPPRRPPRDAESRGGGGREGGRELTGLTANTIRFSLTGRAVVLYNYPGIYHGPAPGFGGVNPSTEAHSFTRRLSPPPLVACYAFSARRREGNKLYLIHREEKSQEESKRIGGSSSSFFSFFLPFFFSSPPKCV